MKTFAKKDIYTDPAELNPDPLMVICVPPCVPPLVGDTPVTIGVLSAANVYKFSPVAVCPSMLTVTLQTLSESYEVVLAESNFL